MTNKYIPRWPRPKGSRGQYFWQIVRAYSRILNYDCDIKLMDIINDRYIFRIADKNNRFVYFDLAPME